MISKERFILIMKKLEEDEEQSLKVNNLLGEIFEDGQGYPKNNLRIILEQNIKEIFNDDTDYSDIDFFMYELNYGKRWTPLCYTEFNIPIDISTSEKLYDYLIYKMRSHDLV